MGRFLHAGLLLQHLPGHLLAWARPASRYRSPTLIRRSSLAVSRRDLIQASIPPHHNDARPCTYSQEPSHPMSCSVASGHRCPLAAIAARRHCTRRDALVKRLLPRTVCSTPHLPPHLLDTVQSHCPLALLPTIIVRLRCRCRARSHRNVMDKAVGDKSWVASPLPPSWCACVRRLGWDIASPLACLGSVRWHARARHVATMLHPHPVQLASPMTYGQNTTSRALHAAPNLVAASLHPWVRVRTLRRCAKHYRCWRVHRATLPLHSYAWALCGAHL
jgi:hypothetical protein